MPGQPQQLALFARCRERQSARSTGGGTYVSSHPPVWPGDAPPSPSGGAIPVNFCSLVHEGSNRSWPTGVLRIGAPLLGDHLLSPTPSRYSRVLRVCTVPQRTSPATCKKKLFRSDT